MSNPVFWENKKNTSLSSAELAQRMVKVRLVPESTLRILQALNLYINTFALYNDDPDQTVWMRRLILVFRSPLGARKYIFIRQGPY